MSGFEDSITGQMVMAGSPDTIMCLDVDFEVLLGNSGRPIIGFKKLKEMCVKHNKTEELYRINVAEKLVIAAQRLFCHPTGKGTALEDASAAVEILKVK